MRGDLFFHDATSHFEVDAVFAGILEASDEEIDVLRDAGYTFRDLRTVTSVAFLKDVGVG